MDASNTQSPPVQDQLVKQLLQMQLQIEQQEKHMAQQALIINNLQSQAQQTMQSLKEKTTIKPDEGNIEASVPMRERIPQLEKFNGDRSLWDEWYLGAAHKLKADGEVIGDDFNKFMYIYSRLEGDAAKMVSSTVKRLSENGSGRGLEFLNYLNSIFGDPNKKAKAQRELYNLRQKEKEPFALFLTKFETVLADAGWTTYEDDQKISLLKNALSKEMQQALVGRKLGPGWNQAIGKLQVISSDITSIYQQYHSQPYFQPKPQKPYQNSIQFPTSREWGSTKKASSQMVQKKATWVSKDTLSYRKEKGLCMRCGHKGHISPQCNYLPPEKPTRVQNLFMKDKMEEEEIDSLALPEGLEIQQGKEELLQ